LLQKGAKVYIAARSEEKTNNTIEELKEETGRDSVFFLSLDLSDLASVKTAVEEFRSKETELHMLYNNG
jgi:retinol dehydrogenase 12